MLVDSNVSLHILQPDHPQHDTATEAIRNLTRQGESLCIMPQNLVEVWTVATKPVGAGNGLGMSTEAAATALGRLKSLFAVLAETKKSMTRGKLW